MELTTQDYLKKALLDTQERLRDFQNYSQEIDDEEISACFKRFAENEGMQASELQRLITKKLGQ
jgi:rubrerythrin